MTLRTAAGRARLDGTWITLAAVAALLASGCGGAGKGGGGTPPPPAGFTISGAVSGASSVTVTLGAAGAADRTTTTGASGSYAFGDVAGGTYTVKAAKAGFAVAPLSQVVTVAGADVSGVNFAATASAGAGSTISGTITTAWGTALSNVTVTLSAGDGSTLGTTVTDATGRYAISGVPDGSYGVTPSLAGWGFAPAAPVVAVSGADVTRSFTADGAYTIAGTVTTAWGSPLQGVSVSLAGDGVTKPAAITAADGTYTVTGVPNGAFTLTPSRSGYAFTPAAPGVTVSGANATRDFTADGAYTISGTVTGVAVSGVSIALSGGGVVKPAAVTGANGAYTIGGVPNGTYTLTPSLAGYTVSPGSPLVVVSGASQVQDFTSSAGASYGISGTLTGAGGAPLPGMTVRLSGSATAIQTTDASGAYTFAGLAQGGTYTVAPAVFGYTFTQPSQTFPSLTASQAASFSTAQPAPLTYTGTLSYAGARSGPVYVTVGHQSGTGLAAQAGPWSGRAFTVRNVPSQYVSVTVWMDTLGIGHFNAAADPSVTLDASATTNPFSLGNLTLLDPVGIPSVGPGDGVRIDEVVPFDRGAIVAISPPSDVNGHEAADSYRVYWNTGPTVDAAHFAGSLLVPAGGNLAIVKGLTNGVGYWFRVVAYVGATPRPGPGFATPSSTVIGPSTGAATVSGTVTYPSLPSPSALYVVAAAGEKGPHFVQRIANLPGTQTGYELSVPAGTYRFLVVVDLGDDGFLQPGEPTPEAQTFAGTVTLAAGANGGPALTVPAGTSTAAVHTMRWANQGTSGTALQLDVASNLSPTRVLPLAVSVTGPGIPGGVSDLAADAWGGGGGLHVGTFLPTDPVTPNVGERYAFAVTYTDGSTDGFSMPITGLFGSAPTPVTPAAGATGASTTPTFQWTAPASPPAAYGYQLRVGPQSGQDAWSVSLPAGTTQVAWNADGRALGSQLAGLTAEGWSVSAVDVDGNLATFDGTFTTGVPQVTTYDPLWATTLDGNRWQTPQYARTIAGGQAHLAVAAGHMQGRLVQGLSYTNALNVVASGSRVTTLRADVSVPAAGAFRNGATATLTTGLRLNYQPGANRNLPFPASNQNLTVFGLEFVDAGGGPRLRARAYHCDTGDCTSLSSTGITFSTPPAGFTQEGVNVVAAAAYDTSYTLELSVDENAGVLTWSVSGGLTGSGTMNISAWAATAGLTLASPANGFASAQLQARVHDESVAGGGSGGFTPAFDNVSVGLNGGPATVYDDFESFGSTAANGLSVSRWSSDRALNGSVDVTDAVHLRASYLTPSTASASANTSLGFLFPASFTTVVADLAIVSDTGAPGLDYVQLGGAFLNDGAGALHDATGDHLANVILRTTGASYWIARCSSANCGSQTPVTSGSLPGGSIPFGLGTQHTVAIQWDAASQRLGFVVDNGAPVQVVVPVGAAVPPYNPTKYVQSAVSIPSGTAGTSAAIDATVANVRTVP